MCVKWLCINEAYRQALFDAYPMYTADEIHETCLGNNPNFISQTEWVQAFLIYEQDSSGDESTVRETSEDDG